MRTKGEGTYGYDEDKKLHWWRIRVDGRSIVRKAKTPTLLRAAVRKALAELEATGKIQTTEERGWSFGAWCYEWLAVYVRPHRKPATHRFYKQIIDYYLVPLEADGSQSALYKKKLRALTQTDCQRVINRVTQELELSSTTAMHTRSVLLRVLKKALELGLIKSNPGLSTTPVSPAQSNRRSLPPDRVADVLAEALRVRELRTRPGEWVLCHNDGPLVAYMLATGVRIGEALATNVMNLTLSEKPRVLVHQQLDWDDGWWDLGSVKGKAQRVIPLSKTAIAAVNAQMALLAADKKRAGQDYTDNGFLFADGTGGPLRERNVARSIDSILGAIDARTVAEAEAAGQIVDGTRILGHYSPHDLRHTFGTVRALKGVALHVLRDLMGHQDAATTAKYYLHVFGPDLEHAVNVGDSTVSLATLEDAVNAGDLVAEDVA